MKKRGARFRVSKPFARTADGVVFASQRECDHYCVLKMRQRAGLISELELQPKFPVSINGLHYCTYTADFSYVDAETGERMIVECKSTGTAKDAAYRLRKKAAELFYGIKVTVVT